MFFKSFVGSAECVAAAICYFSVELGVVGELLFLLEFAANC